MKKSISNTPGMQILPEDVDTPTVRDCTDLIPRWEEITSALHSFKPVNGQMGFRALKPVNGQMGFRGAYTGPT